MKKLIFTLGAVLFFGVVSAQTDSTVTGKNKKSTTTKKSTTKTKTGSTKNVKDTVADYKSPKTRSKDSIAIGSPANGTKSGGQMKKSNP